MRKPLIGICAGFNNILRALGTIHSKDYRHKISVNKETKLYNLINADEYSVNSIHSMIAPKENVEGYAKISSISYV